MPETAQLFITCLIDTLYPEIGEAVVRVLARAGVTVEFPADQTCCGQPAYNAGMREQAMPIAKHTIRVFEKTSCPIVIPSGSCAAMIRHGYLELFSGDSQWLTRSKSLIDRTYEFSEFLVDYLGITNLGLQYPGRVTYHPSCHLSRDLGIKDQPLALLSNLQGAQVLELPNAEECCGFGGVFSVEYPEISTAMLARKISHIESSGASQVVSCDAGCISNINGGLHRQGKTPRVLHIAEILNQALEMREGGAL
jgi:L-lactate dehydrogenase complex protein LldE